MLNFNHICFTCTSTTLVTSKKTSELLYAFLFDSRLNNCVRPIITAANYVLRSVKVVRLPGCLLIWDCIVFLLLTRVKEACYLRCIWPIHREFKVTWSDTVTYLMFFQRWHVKLLGNKRNNTINKFILLISELLKTKC